MTSTVMMMMMMMQLLPNSLTRPLSQPNCCRAAARKIVKKLVLDWQWEERALLQGDVRSAQKAASTGCTAYGMIGFREIHRPPSAPTRYAAYVTINGQLNLILIFVVELQLCDLAFDLTHQLCDGIHYLYTYIFIHHIMVAQQKKYIIKNWTT